MSALHTGTSYMPNRYHYRNSFEKGFPPDRQGMQPKAAYTSLSFNYTSSRDISYYEDELTGKKNNLMSMKQQCTTWIMEGYSEEQKSIS